METARELSVLLSGGSYFEAPRWHDGTWWVSDFYRRHVSHVGGWRQVKDMGRHLGQYGRTNKEP